MKSYVIFFALWISVPFLSHSEIINGYSKELNGIRKAKSNLETLLRDSSLLKCKQKSLQKEIKKLTNREAICNKYFKKTEVIIGRIKSSFAEIFQEIDKIEDATGVVTDVFVSVVERHSLPGGAEGITNVDASDRNPHIYVSEYGDRSVSVKVVDNLRAHRNLLHEFGHVLYQVPNLNSYVEYYKMNYYQGYRDKHGFNIGHKPSDPSAQSVNQVLNKYKNMF